MVSTLIGRCRALGERLDVAGVWLAPLGLRLLLAWEFWEAGITKLQGQNWFARLRPSDSSPPSSRAGSRDRSSNGSANATRPSSAS